MARSWSAPWRRPLAPILAILAMTGAARAQPQTDAQSEAGRAEVAIREVVLSDGEHRYTVPIQVGSTTIQAGLDSGSTGLRILPGVLKPDEVKASGARTSYFYTSGTQFDGVIAEAQTTIGLSGPVKFQQIQDVSCHLGAPCPAKRVPLAQFGIQGSGLPGEGFKAILGINMGPHAVANPLIQLGVRRWIIELPRPGEGKPGRLVLNPTDAEVADYKAFRTTGDDGGLHDAISGCLINQGTKKSLCGPATLDTGAPNIQVALSDPGQAWAPGTMATMAFYADRKPMLVADFEVASGPGARLTLEERPRIPNTRLFLGVLPYFVFSALYDPEARTVALKAR